MLRALCTKDPEKMKVNLVEETGDLLQQIGEQDFAQENFIFAREIRKENNWFVKDELTNKILTDQKITFIEIRSITKTSMCCAPSGMLMRFETNTRLYLLLLTRRMNCHR